MKYNGFSLIELLVVVSILSMLMVVGTASYTRYIQKSELLQAQSDLLILASKLEQYKLFNLSYLGAAGSQDSPENTGKPWIFEAYSPASKPEQERVFDLSISYLSEDALAFQIKATPSDDTSAQRSHGELIYYSDGRRGYDKNKDGIFTSSEMCWEC